MNNTNKVGLLFAALFAVWHLAWIGLVVIGWAQPFLDFTFWAHMIQPVYHVQPFDPRAAGILVIITATIGYMFGFLGALIWRRLHAR